MATDDVVVVVEGKRTELAPTTNTTWMPERHQMLRHLDAAWESLGGRRLIGLMIVEGPDGLSDVSVPWCEYRSQLNSGKILAGSMPHRTEAERQSILRCFAGITTWQAVTDALGVPRAVLIPELAAGGL